MYKPEYIKKIRHMIIRDSEIVTDQLTPHKGRPGQVFIN